MSATRAVQAARTVAAAVVLLTTALLAHRLMGGADIPALGLAAGGVASLVAGGIVGIRRRSVAVLAAIAVLGQGGLHVLFSVGPFGGSRGDVLARLLCGHGHLDPAATVTLQTGGARAALAAAPSVDPASAIAMVAGHSLAALLLLVWLRAGERCALRVFAALVAGLVLVRPVMAPVAFRRTLQTWKAPWTSRLHLVLAGVVTRRGPPLAAC